MSNFTKIRPVGSERFHADGQTDMTQFTALQRRLKLLSNNDCNPSCHSPRYRASNAPAHQPSARPPLLAFISRRSLCQVSIKNGEDNSSSTDNRQKSSRMGQLTSLPTPSCYLRGQLNGGIHRKGVKLKKKIITRQHVIRSSRANRPGDGEASPLCKHARYNMNTGATVTEVQRSLGNRTTVRVPGWSGQFGANYSPVMLNGIVTTEHYCYYYYYYYLLLGTLYRL
jgi:hypothetical protein